MYDLVVVGGGPAGSVCAREAARRGLEVVLIEQERYPRNKLCGGALSSRIVDIIDFDISPIVHHDIHCVRIHTPSGRSIKVMKDDVKGFLVRRSEFDDFLVKKAMDAGVEVVENAKILSIEQIKRGIRALSHGDSFKGHLLVGADGVNSIVARSLDIRSKWPMERIALCIAADIPLSPNEINRILSSEDTEGHLTIETYPWAMPHGYGWCFPKRDEISLGIGYAMKHGVLNLRDEWASFVRKFEKEKDLRLDLTNPSVHQIPLAKFDKRIITRRTMLVGDAAGLASPITGEGLYYAIRSGMLAGEVAVESVRDKDPTHVRLYEHRLKKELNTEFSAANFVSNLLYKSESNVELLCELTEDDPLLQDYMIELALGSRSINRIRIDITKRMMLHHPLKALQLLH